jgi:hypothetical protein
MSSHTKLHSKADFDKAIATEGKYVLIHAYSNEIFPKAEEYARNSSSAVSFKTDGFSLCLDMLPSTAPRAMHTL